MGLGKGREAKIVLAVDIGFIPLILSKLLLDTVGEFVIAVST